MTFADRIKAVSDFGLTERQARFLVTVMLHGGVCVPRQYARFAGTAYGQNVNAFFDKLVSASLAVRCGCVPQPRAGLPRASRIAVSGNRRAQQPEPETGPRCRCDAALDGP